ncbi:3-hydroxyacyl-CoA dehydrogenase [Nakamurella panacisegetis]|uniref:3-hydroxyacyl-CoA dehydrogenase n=1 Tax=Nakamurella panacisegetis TaxID=1090615 RepID=A0A1H0INX3_9ACTN|nr:3-hydroxybutyryl-CoA dehydrogenase [Nakamurella panacisegetis]SDO33063.1 3-hydroxyacyl-CoA dehydrogenase [Nakamurella panacisegetis]
MSAPTANGITRVGVVGGGLMGSGIAEVCARSGLDVVVSEVREEFADSARQRVATSLARAVKSGKATDAEAAQAQGRIRVLVGLDALADRQLVIEAATENEQLKLKVFTDLDAIVTDPEAILASNTSSIPISKLAVATNRPHRVVGVHFFNPATVQKLVEIIPSLLTSEETVATVVDFAERGLGKTVVRAKDRAGFVVNALLIPYLLSAVRMFEAGHASAEDIDNGMVLGCAHPMGPLRLLDLVGLDTTRSAAESMYAEYGEPHFAPPALLSRMVEAGLLGRKTGRGFYTYA